MKQTIIIAALGATLYAAQPDIRNAEVTTELAQPNIQEKVNSLLKTGKTSWIGYEVKTLDSHHNSYNGCGDVHYLEGGHNHTYSGEAHSVAILLRSEAHAITKLEAVSTDCHIDGGGIPFHWLTGVNGEDSVKLLTGLLTGGGLGDSALFAIAIHEASGATQVLKTLASGGKDEHTKEQAAFWLGVQRGHDGFLALQTLAKSSDAEFRKKLTFDFSQNSDPGAVDELIRLAKADESADVRGQALFWLAQKAGKKQAAAIGDSAGNDPDTAVKKKAVFALTQLPKEESYQQLVKVAETNRDPAVRKDAIFWLGQSHDPRAAGYLESILKR